MNEGLVYTANVVEGRIMNRFVQFRKLIALTLIGFSLACLAQGAESNEPTDEVSPELPDVTQRYDFNGDGHPDFVLTTMFGQTAIWYLNNNIYLSGAGGPSLPRKLGLD